MKKMTLKDQVEFFRCMTLSMMILLLTTIAVFHDRTLMVVFLLGLVSNASLCMNYTKKLKEEEAAKAAEAENVTEE